MSSADGSDDLRAELQRAIGERYEVQRELGRGGMAIVFLAHERKHRRDVALKVLKPSLSSGLEGERFLREIRLASRLVHPHILALYDSGEAGDLLYYVTPYVAGESLRARMGHHPDGLPLDQALRLAAELCDALAYAHERDLVHRDVKPENILLLEGHAVLADFGLALALDAAADERLTTAGAAVGTPRYMSPELATGSADVGPASDIYSLACVIHELLTGAPPFDGTSVRQLMARHITEAPPSLMGRAGIPNRVASGLLRSLAKDPAERWASARELAAALAPGADAAPHSPPTASLAVLPFENLGDDPTMEYFSDGVTEEILSALAKIGGLRVIGRASSFALKGQKLDPETIGRRLRVDSIVTGSVRRSGDRVRIAAELVSSTSGFRVWSERFDRELGDVFALQDEIAAAVANNLVTPESAPTLPLVEPPRPDAYDAYLEGRFYQNHLQPDALRKALSRYERAVELDPGFALGWTGIAEVHALLAIGFAVRSSRAAFDSARAAADRALELAPELAEAHVARAVVALFFEWRFDDAHAALQRGLALKPGLADGHMWSEFYWTYVRRDYGRAVAALQRALAIEPLHLAARQRLATTHYIFGRYDLAHAELDAILEVEPNNPLALLARGDTLLREGRPDEALESLERAVAAGGRAVAFLGVLATISALAGRRGRAEEILADFLAAEPRPSFWIGLVQAALGDVDAGVAGLTRAADERDPNLLYLTAVPEIDGLRRHPDYRALLERIGLEPGGGSRP